MSKHINKYKPDGVRFFSPQRTIDFHEFGQLHPYDVEKLLTEFIEDAHIAGCSEVLVITGKGKIVRPVVEQVLKRNKLVTHFRPAGYFNGQTGAFEVELVFTIN